MYRANMGLFKETPEAKKNLPIIEQRQMFAYLLNALQQMQEKLRSCEDAKFPLMVETLEVLCQKMALHYSDFLSKCQTKTYIEALSGFQEAIKKALAEARNNTENQSSLNPCPFGWAAYIDFLQHSLVDMVSVAVHAETNLAPGFS